LTATTSIEPPTAGLEEAALISRGPLPLADPGSIVGLLGQPQIRHPTKINVTDAARTLVISKDIMKMTL
jgi:hypothetical protein